MSSLPIHTNAEPQVASGIDMFNAGDVVHFACNDNFAATDAFPGCTCIADTAGDGASWECNLDPNANANVEVCQPGKYKTGVASGLFVCFPTRQYWRLEKSEITQFLCFHWSTENT